VESAPWLDGVSSTAVDECTFSIQLDKPRNHFLYLLGQPALFAWPRHVYERRGSDWYRDVPLVGNGPFVLTHRDGSRLLIVSARTWYGARGNVGEVTIERASPEEAGDRWRSGEYDLIYEGLAPLAGAVATDETVVVQRGPGDSRGTSASTRRGRRSTTPVSAVPSRTQSTGTGRHRP
jgi:ABC-type oligopeptide transport system substrate-binding subunit